MKFFLTLFSGILVSGSHLLAEKPRLLDEAYLNSLRAEAVRNQPAPAAAVLRTEAANDSAAATDTPAPPAPEPPDWRVLDSAYQDHHFKCPICIAAGIRPRTSQRCGVGAALWVAYETAALNTPPPWRQPKGHSRD